MIAVVGRGRAAADAVRASQADSAGRAASFDDARTESTLDPSDADRRHRPQRPVHRRTRLRADDDGGLLVRDGVIVGPRPVRRAARRAPRRAGRRPDAAGCCCPASSTPTCTTRRSGPSAGWACRCWTGWSGARCPRRRGWPTRRTPGGGRRVPRRPAGGAGTTTALVFGSHFAPAMDALFTAAERAGCGSPPAWCVSDRILRDGPAAPPRTAPSPRAARWSSAGTAGPAPLRRHAAVLAVGVGRRCWTPAPELLLRDGRRLVHLAHQREPGRGRDGRRRCSRALRTTSTPTTEHGLVGRAQRARPQRPPHRRRAARCWPGTGRLGRPLPDQQRRPGQRAVPAAPARRARRRGRARAPTSAPAPGSACSRRDCRPTSSSSCSDPTGCR